MAQLAEKAAFEHDPEKLLALVEELNGALLRTEANARQRRDSLSA